MGPDRLAYQVLGQGPPDLVLAMGAFSHVDIVWEDPRTALFLRADATARYLVAGSDVVLQDHGSQPLKGVEGDWQLFGLAGR